MPDSDTPHDLALINEATAKLKTAQSLDEVWAVHGIARAAHLAARRRGSRRAVAAANVIRFDAERRLGEVSRALPKDPGGRRPKNSPMLGEGFDGMTKAGMLERMGISTQRASDFEAMARIHLDDFKVEAAKPSATTRSLADLGRDHYFADGTRKPTDEKREPKVPTPADLIERAVKYLRRAMTKGRPTRMAIQVEMRDRLETDDGRWDRWRPACQDSERWNVLESIFEQLQAAETLPLRLPAEYRERVHRDARDYIHDALKRGLGRRGRTVLPRLLEESEREAEDRLHEEAAAAALAVAVPRRQPRERHLALVTG